MDINKGMLARDLSDSTGISAAKAEAVLDALLEMIKTNARMGHKVAIRGFGVFTAKESQARTGRNPSTGAAVQIAASRSLKFKPYGKL